MSDIQMVDKDGGLVTIGTTDVSPTPEALALQLWKDWFSFCGNPWIQDDYGRMGCYFCVEDHPGHAEDCIFVKAQKLIQQ